VVEPNALTWEEAVLWLRGQESAREAVLQNFFDDPILSAAERYHSSSEWRAVRALLPNSKGNALDVGAGRGISSYALAKEGWKVTALEPDISGVVGTGAIRQLIRQSLLDIEIVNEAGETLSFPADHFDLVYCRAVLHHARDMHQLCREIHRVLRPGGYFVATREHVISRRNDLQTFLNNHPLHRFYGGENAYRLSEYKAAILKSGLILDRVINPFQSDINLFPETINSVKSRFRTKLRYVPRRFISNTALSFFGACSRTPGRLYSFVAKKSNNKAENNLRPTS
jgi:SAM-dependent methyltransferase